MSTIVDFTIATEECSLVQPLQGYEYERVELDRAVQLDNGLVPFIWIYGSDPEAIRECLLADERVSAVSVLDRLDGAALVRVEWTPETDGLLELIDTRDAELVEATGTPERWAFRLRFHSQNEVSAFQQACREEGLSLNITAVSDLREEDAGPNAQAGVTASAELTPAQREVLVLAIEGGYFDVPRRTTATELGERLGISDQAVSERLRRAVKKAGTNAVFTELNGSGSSGRTDGGSDPLVPL